MHPSLVLHNGSIHTGVAGAPRAAALAVWGDRVVCVGASAEVLAAAGPQTRVVDLQGRFVTPGLIDCHVHLASLALALGGHTVECDGARSLAEVLQRVRAAVARLRPGEWLRGRGWDKNQWTEERFPTSADLDAVTGELPALLASHDEHSVWANSAALRLAGITAETPDPPRGRILRAADGRPTGVLQEGAAGLLWEHVPPPSPAEVAEALAAALPRLSALGLTGLHDCDGADSRRALAAARESGALSLRVTQYYSPEALEHLAALGLRSGCGDEWVRLGGLKVFVDGALGGQTAAMLQPYEGSADAGLSTMTPEAFADLAARATDAGLAVAVHAIGDAAVRMVLDGFEQARGRGSAWPRHRVEHAQHIHPDDQPRFAALDLIASMQPAHLLADIPTCERYLGPRGRWAFPLRALHDGGAHLAFGSDAPVETVNPLAGLRAAVLRQSHAGTPRGGWYPEQRLTVEEALAAYTLGAARASGEEHLKGTLTPGRLADFVVWSHDLGRVPAEEWGGVRALATVVGGRVAHDPEGLCGSPAGATAP